MPIMGGGATGPSRALPDCPSSFADRLVGRAAGAGEECASGSSARRGQAAPSAETDNKLVAGNLVGVLECGRPVLRPSQIEAKSSRTNLRSVVVASRFGCER